MINKFPAAPGSVKISDSMLHAMQKNYYHRTHEFTEIFNYCAENLQQFFDSPNKTIILGCSGTGVMEASITNTLSPNDKIICLEFGKFSQRFSQIASAYGCQVISIRSPEGTCPDPEILYQTLKQNPDTKLITTCHCETSTGVLAPIEEYAKITQNHESLFVVDSISTAGAVPINQAQYNIDICLGTGNKGFLIPEGCGFLSYYGDKFLNALQQSTIPKFYLNIEKEKEAQILGNTLWTPPVHNILLLEESLRSMLDEGIENIYKRHKKIADYIRQRCQEMGLKLVTQSGFTPSDTVHAFFTKTGSQNIIQKMYEQNILIADGQDSLKGRIIRIASFNFKNLQETEWLLNCLEKCL